MDHFHKLKQEVYRYLAFMLLASNLLIIALWLAGEALGLPQSIVGVAMFLAAVAAGLTIAGMATNYVLEPLNLLWQAILYVTPKHIGTSAPDPNKARIGRELVTSLILQVYQFASQQDSKSLAEHRRNLSQAANIVDHLPLPLFVFNKQQLVTNASSSALEYCQLQSSDLFGKPLFDSLDLEFPGEDTLEKWVFECQENKVTDHKTWEHVRVRLKDQQTLKQCDITAYYSRDNPSGTEFIVTLFDRTQDYNQDDQDLGLVSLAVHELRTPLTMLRGYIEVFEDELADTLNPEMKDFMHKMSVSAQQLTIFINNILNVARIEANQLTLRLNEEKWDDMLRKFCDDLNLRAEMYGKTLELNIAPDLPTVGVDRVSMYEVVANLVENAIKYSGASSRIVVGTNIAKDGMIETHVQDFGVGIPASVLPNLFERFYRNHRTKAQVGGSGLGLYLCKAIVTAHGGNIWANSKEGAGSTFSFTVQPYARLADELKNGNNDITRTAHGWIKNHSLYRR